MEEAKDSSLIDPSTLKQIPSKEAEDSSLMSPVHQRNSQRGSKKFSLKILSEPYRKQKILP